jgi:hypothetical protein
LGSDNWRTLDIDGAFDATGEQRDSGNGQEWRKKI